jgi:hypothetical protein
VSRGHASVDRAVVASTSIVSNKDPAWQIQAPPQTQAGSRSE